MAEATATASDAVLPERPEPALSIMDSPTFPENDRVDRSDLHGVPSGDLEGCASTASSEPRGKLFVFQRHFCAGALWPMIARGVNTHASVLPTQTHGLNRRDT